jgi:hypothetical protein
MQFRPTTAAPASARRLQASAGDQPSRVSGSWWIASVTTASRPAARMTSVASSASPANWKVSAMTKSTSASAAHPTCSSNIARTVRRDAASSR